MNETILTTIKSGIVDLFPDVGKVPITAQMRLGDIPDYDSMAAVNLQVFLEERFPLKVSLDMLTEDMTLGELIEYIGRYVKNN